MHWQQPSSSSSYYPSYHHSNPIQENLPTYISPTVSVILPNISLRFHHRPNPTIYNLPSATATNNTPHAKHTEPNTLSPLSAQQPEPSHQSNNFPTFGTIHTITGGSNLDFQNKWQKREYYHRVNHVVVEGLITWTKLSHIQLTFTIADIKLVSFPYTDVMVITSY
jgi:hypothetical protein